jgi:hypothetical protein
VRFWCGNTRCAAGLQQNCHEGGKRFIFEKRTKKLLLLCSSTAVDSEPQAVLPQKSKSLFASFSSEKEGSCF